ncbi:hypothetical protein [uncultured Chryseobacterium sp.]|uniref:hypothetical protein n=1 Tax=uncultured Chryseobacterium sp. TaxID=259322 RepID=UPI0025850BC2|nr:hypothetical protein [uncultured Chryseobacterium sp.]
MKLIPLSDFVLEQLEIQQSTSEFKEVVRNYTHFLKQPLTLGMFVPIEEEGNVLKPCGCISDCCKDQFEYENAKEKVLFANAVTIDESPYKMTERLMIDLNHPASFRIYNKFTFNDGIVESQFLPNFSKNPTVEYLVDYGLELTPSALEAIGIK